MRDRVLVTYVPRDRTPYKESIDDWLLEQVCDALASDGADPRPVAFMPGEMGLVAIQEPKRAVLNMAYGYLSADGGVRLDQASVSREIEDAGFFPVGSDSSTQALVQDKALCGEWMQGHGYRAPRHYTSSAELGSPDSWLVVKPRFGAAHRDVRLVQAGVLCEERWPKPSFIVQAYANPPEYTLGVIDTEHGPCALPPLQLGPAQGPADGPWVMTGSADWTVTPVESDPYGLRRLSVALFVRLGMRDLARFDIRLSEDTLVILDVNSLPNLHPTRSYLPMAAAAAGINLTDLVASITRRARAAASASQREICSG